MTSDQIRNAQRVRPFQPFSLHLVDGRELWIRHPETAMLSPQGRTVQNINSDRLTEVVDVLMIVSLRPLSSIELSTRR
jgi:hypothetical protein